MLFGWRTHRKLKNSFRRFASLRRRLTGTLEARDRIMSTDAAFADLIRRVACGDEDAAAHLVRDFEPIVRRVVRGRLRSARPRRDFDSMDICQSVLAIFFVRAAAGQYELQQPSDLIKLLLTMTRNKLAEQLRRQ